MFQEKKKNVSGKKCFRKKVSGKNVSGKNVSGKKCCRENQNIF
jgi:hypothetical protein